MLDSNIAPHNEVPNFKYLIRPLFTKQPAALSDPTKQDSRLIRRHGATT